MFLARRSFVLPQAPERAVIYLTADTRYQLFVNGTFVARGPARSAAHHQSYDAIALDGLLHRGKNLIAVRLHHTGLAQPYHEVTRPGLLVQLEMHFGREVKIIGTDPQWKIVRDPSWDPSSPRINRWHDAFVDIIDLRQHAGDWLAGDFDDTSWPAAVSIVPGRVSPAAGNSQIPGSQWWPAPQAEQTVSLPHACGKIIAGLIDQGGHLIFRLKKNACAYTVPPAPRRAGRGRPRLYGTKIRLRDLFTGPLATMPSPVYDEHSVTLRWTCRDLLWRPAGRLVRFVAVVHPHCGQILLLSTDLTLAPAEIIRLYALRFKIEVSFKQALHSVGTWAYHFWMRPMTPLRRFQGDQILHHKSAAYRTAIRRKLDAYHRHIQIGLVAQGLLQCLAALHPTLVWRHFGSWLRTVRSPHCPSEFVVACALRHSLPDFLAASPQATSFELFLRQRLDLQRIEGTCLLVAEQKGIEAARLTRRIEGGRE